MKSKLECITDNIIDFFFGNHPSEYKEKIVNILAGDYLIKTKIIAVKEWQNDIIAFRRILCFIPMVINGEILSADLQKEQTVVLKSNSTPSINEQKELLQQMLNNLSIIGSPVVVSDKYEKSHLRLIKLKQRIKR